MNILIQSKKMQGKPMFSFRLSYSRELENDKGHLISQVVFVSVLSKAQILTLSFSMEILGLAAW
jgi:hypothetical protein